MLAFRGALVKGYTLRIGYVSQGVMKVGVGVGVGAHEARGHSLAWTELSSNPSGKTLSSRGFHLQKCRLNQDKLAGAMVQL